MYVLDCTLWRNNELHSGDATYAKPFSQFRIFGGNAGFDFTSCLIEFDLPLLKRICV